MRRNTGCSTSFCVPAIGRSTSERTSANTPCAWPEIVGPTGRVIAVEPIPETFALLAENARHAGHGNVSLLNCAASERTAILGMEIPRWSDGLDNYYQAHVVTGTAGLTILAFSIDSLALPPCAS